MYSNPTPFLLQPRNMYYNRDYLFVVAREKEELYM
jgi:hypothetical protein